MTKEEFREKMRTLGWENEVIDKKLAIYEKWEKECKANGWELEPLESHVHQPVLD